MALSDRNAKALEARGIDVELALKLGVENSPKHGFDIAIPYRVGDAVVNRKYRTVGRDEKRFSQDKGARKCFWNFDVLTDTTLTEGGAPLLITEGEFDALIAMQCGYQLVVSVPDGAPAEAQGESEGEKYSYVSDARAALTPFREIVLCTDGDGPGVNLLNDLALRLGKPRCRWVRYPKGCKDLNEVFQRCGESAVREVIQSAMWIRVDGVYRMSELPPLPYAKPHHVGIIGLDRHYNMREGDFAVFTSLPGHGKTALLNHISFNAVELHDWKVAVASFEQKPQADHRRALRTLYTGKLEIHQSPEELDAADGWIDRNFVFAVPDEDDDVTLEWLLERLSVAVVRHDCKLVVIDPWNEMDHARPPDMTMTEYVGFAIKQLKKFAAKHRVHVIVVAHPAKMQRARNGEYPVPTPYDISDSAHWYNKPDVILVLHRTETGDTLIRIVKSRYYREIGRPGEVTARFDETTNRFAVIDGGERL